METRIVHVPVIEILYEQESDRSVAEELSFGIEEQGVVPRIRRFAKGKEYDVQAFESAQKGYGVALCIVKNRVMIFTEDTGDERPLLNFYIGQKKNAKMLRSIGKNAVHVITRQPFEYV